jgi:hypothetical protein
MHFLDFPSKRDAWLAVVLWIRTAMLVAVALGPWGALRHRPSCHRR